jgi:hypothetical protein
METIIIYKIYPSQKKAQCKYQQSEQGKLKLKEIQKAYYNRKKARKNETINNIDINL